MARARSAVLLGGLAFAGLGVWQVGGADSQTARPEGVASPSHRPADRALEEIVAAVEQCAEAERCFRLAYVWSPSMPLSRTGIAEVARAAGYLGIALDVLPARELEEPRAVRAEERLRTTLVNAGATVHFPTLVVLDGRETVGSAFAGYKEAGAYASLVRARLAEAGVGEVGSPAPLAPEIGSGGSDGTSDGTSAATPAAAPDAAPRAGSDAGRPGDIDVVWTHTVSPAAGAFFRRVPGTSFIAYDQRNAVHLRDLETERTFRGPGYIDFVPTPDGIFFVTPDRGSRGLEFYLAAEVFEEGAAGSAADLEPVFVDRELTDQYPSVGILERDGQGRAVHYRILVSWFSGLAFRDYAVSWGDDGQPTVAPTTPEMEGCPGLALSTPILSKDGRELAARHEETGTTKLLRMEDDGACRELFDLGRQTSKVGFSDDGQLIAYSSPNPARDGSGTSSTTYVLDRAEMRTTEIPHSASAGLVIPELVGADSLLIAVRESDSSSTEFRLLCCVR